MKKKIFIVSMLMFLCVTFANNVKAESYSMGSQTVIIEGTDGVQIASNVDGVVTIKDSDKNYGTMSLKVVGTSGIIDDDIYFGIAVDAMSNSRGSVSSSNRYASKNMTITATIQTTSSETSGYNGLNEANFQHMFNPETANSFMSYDTGENANILSRISNNDGLYVETPSGTNTTIASYYYTFDGYSSNRTYPNCGEYHQIALFFFKADDNELHGINIEVKYSLTIFRDRTALSNKERTGTVTATVTL